MADLKIEQKKWNGSSFDNLYPVTTAESVKMANGENAEKVVNESAFYQGIKTETLYDSISKTTYYLTTIPYLDSKGNINKIKRGFAKDLSNSGQTETARSFAARKNASVVVNASHFDTSTFKLIGTQITNGVVINTDGTRPDRYVLGIKDDGTFKYYDPSTPTSSIISDGVKEALTSFLPLINNNVRISQSVIDTYEAAGWSYRRQVIGQMPNNDYVILSTESDVLGNVGFTVDDCIRVLLAKGLKFAFMLDGGGSMQTVVRGRNVVSAKDDYGKTERSVPDFLYFSKPYLTKRDEDINDSHSDLGDVKKKVGDLEYDIYHKVSMNEGYMQLKGAADYTTHGIEVWKGENKTHKLIFNENDFGFYDYAKGKFLFQVGLTSGDIITNAGAKGDTPQYATVMNDMNFVGKSGWSWGTTTTSNTPDTSKSWAVQTIRLDTLNALQMATCFSSPYEKKTRRQSGGTWDAWE